MGDRTKRLRAPFLALSTTLLACAGVDPPANEANRDPCGLHSGFPGDELCVLPPKAGAGIQIHVGPASYDDPDALAKYVIEPGVEDAQCYVAPIAESDFDYLRQENRMRTGSHHMLIAAAPPEAYLEPGPENGPVTLTPESFCGSFGTGFIPGSQRPSRDFPGKLGPEDSGLVRHLIKTKDAAFEMHYINMKDQPLLREAWVNLYRAPDFAERQNLESIFLIADVAINIPPHTRQTVTERFKPDLTAPTRIYELIGHSHAHSESFTVNRIHGDTRDVVYQTFDWSESEELIYNSAVQNPAPDPAKKRGGGVSGLLYLEPGDELEWTCEVNNTLNTMISFANEVNTAEMCLLAGSVVSDSPLGTICAGGVCGSTGYGF